MPVSKERRKAITALKQALVWLNAAALALVKDLPDGKETSIVTQEVDRLANDTGKVLKIVRGN